MSGKGAARVGDTGTGHSCHFPPTDATEGSGDVFVNGISAVRQNDAFAPHACGSCPAPEHNRKLASGSATVLINGRQAGRIGDPIDCGGAVAIGSANVFIGSFRPAAALAKFSSTPRSKGVGDGECDDEAGRNE